MQAENLSCFSWIWPLLQHFLLPCLFRQTSTSNRMASNPLQPFPDSLLTKHQSFHLTVSMHIRYWVKKFLLLPFHPPQSSKSKPSSDNPLAWYQALNAVWHGEDGLVHAAELFYFCLVEGRMKVVFVGRGAGYGHSSVIFLLPSKLMSMPCCK